MVFIFGIVQPVTVHYFLPYQGQHGGKVLSVVHYLEARLVQYLVFHFNVLQSYLARRGLLRPPLIEVQSVEYYDADNALQTVDPALYYTVAGFVPNLPETVAAMLAAGAVIGWLPME